MNKKILLPFLFASAFLVACKKEKTSVENETPKISLNGNWDVLEKGTMSISAQGDTTVTNYDWDDVNPLGVVNVIGTTYETIDEVIAVDGVDYLLDEWDFCGSDCSTYSRYIWLEIADTTDSCNYYYVLGKRV